MDKFSSFFYILIFISCFVSFGFSDSYISEIKFVGDEFVEIYSDDFLNFSNEVVIDESLHNNSLSLFKFIENSSYYLIVGKNFIKNTDLGVLNSLNCSVYVSDKSQVSNGGLKSHGEDFSIGNFSFDLSDFNEYDFNDGESLNLVNDSWKVLSESVCGFPVFDLNNFYEEVPKENLSSFSSCGNYSFLVLLKDDVVIDKFSFKFISDYKGDFNVSYWVEDFNGNVVKSVKNSLNFNWKYFSPKKSSALYYFKANLSFGNCSILNFTRGFFHSDYVEYKSSKYKSLKSKVDVKGVGGEKYSSLNSYVKLLNVDEILNYSSDILEYEIYRGDDRKSVVNFFVGSKNVLKLKVDKFVNISGKVKLFVDGYDYLKVLGLGYDDKYNFSIVNISNEKNVKLIKDIKQFFEILNLRQVENEILFNVRTNIDSFESVCYVNLVRTKVSNSLINLVGNLSLGINISKLDDLNSSLKLVCKFRRVGLKSWNYESIKFNFSKSYILEKLNSSVEIFSLFSNSLNVLEKKVDVDKVNEEKLSLEVFEILNENLSANVYEAKNYNFIDNSVDFIISGFGLVLIFFLIVW